MHWLTDKTKAAFSNFLLRLEEEQTKTWLLENLFPVSKFD
jgi:hypothetical protein